MATRAREPRANNQVLHHGRVYVHVTFVHIGNRAPSAAPRQTLFTMLFFTIAIAALCAISFASLAVLRAVMSQCVIPVWSIPTVGYQDLRQ